MQCIDVTLINGGQPKQLQFRIRCFSYICFRGQPKQLLFRIRCFLVHLFWRERKQFYCGCIDAHQRPTPALTFLLQPSPGPFSPLPIIHRHPTHRQTHRTASTTFLTCCGRLNLHCLSACGFPIAGTWNSSVKPELVPRTPSSMMSFVSLRRPRLENGDIRTSRVRVVSIPTFNYPKSEFGG